MNQALVNNYCLCITFNEVYQIKLDLPYTKYIYSIGRTQNTSQTASILVYFLLV